MQLPVFLDRAIETGQIENWSWVEKVDYYHHY